MRDSKLFDGFTDEQLAVVEAKLQLQQFAPGETVVREGEMARRWYAIQQGMAVVSHTDATGQPIQVAVLGPGTSFGESALLPGAVRKRIATVSAVTDLTTYALDRADLDGAVDASTDVSTRAGQELDLMAIDLALKRASPFAPLDKETLWSLARQMRPKHATTGEVIIREGDPGDSFYLIRSGRVEVVRGIRRVAVLRGGDTFGEIALLTESPRTATVRALEETDLLELPREVFLALTGTNPWVSNFFNELIRIRFRGASSQHLLVPDPLTTVMPHLGAHRRKRYWQVLLVGVLLFAALTALAAISRQTSWIYATLAVGSLMGPVVYVIYLAESDILSQRPVELIITGFLGAVLGLPPAYLLQRGTGTMLGDLGPALVVALIEEIAKVLGVVWLLWRPSLRFRMDGLIFGAAAGMGFAALETALYSIARIDALGALLGVLWVRALLSPFTHGTWTAIVCATIWRQRSAGFIRGGMSIVAALATAVVLHGFWDWQPLPIPLNFIWMLVVGATSLFILRLVLQRATYEEARSVFAIAPEIATSTRDAPHLVCSGCGQPAPPGAHYCPRCGLALWTKRG